MTSVLRSPVRFVLVVGGTLGLLLVFAAPGWFGGADEGTHFVRSLAMANGQVFPDRVNGTLSSFVPEAASESIRITIVNGAGTDAPNNLGLIGDLMTIHPDWNRVRGYDTGPTLASTPVAYLPSALAMVVPSAIGAPPILSLWCGRLGDLVVYLALVIAALRVAKAFRWALAITALLPMNLAMAASVSPDAMTIGSLLLTIGVWTRLWRTTGPDADADPRFGSLMRLGTLVAVAGVLLATSKPPYFVVLAAFPVLLAMRHREARARVAGVVATAALGLGVLVSALGASNDYKSAGAGIFAEIRFQPEIQQRRLLDAPLTFLWRCFLRWFEFLPESVQKWSRQLGIWRSELPASLACAVVIVMIVSAIILDTDDLLRLRRFCRSIFAIGSITLVVMLMASAYIFFDDTEEGIHMTDQIARYALPLFAMAIMGWAPRSPLRGHVLDAFRRENWRVASVGTVIAADTLCVGATVLVWFRA